MVWLLTALCLPTAAAEDVDVVPMARWQAPYHPIEVAVDPQGRRVAVSTLDGVRVSDAETGAPLAFLRAPAASVLIFLEDGRRLYTGTRRHQLDLWHVDLEDRLLRLPIGDADVSVTSGDEMVLLADQPRGRFVISALDGRRIALVRIPQTVYSYDWSPAGLLAVSVPNNQVEIHDAIRDADPLTITVTPFDETARPTAPRVAFSPTGALLATTWTGEEPGVRVWRTDTLTPLLDAELPGVNPERVWFSGDGELLYVAGVESAAVPSHVTAVFDLTTPGRVVWVPSPMYPLPGRRAALRTDRGSDTLTVWDPDTERDVATLSFDAPVRTWDVSPSGRHLVVADYSQTVSVFRLDGAERLAGLPAR